MFGSIAGWKITEGGLIFIDEADDLFPANEFVDITLLKLRLQNSYDICPELFSSPETVTELIKMAKDQDISAAQLGQALNNSWNIDLGLDFD